MNVEAFEVTEENFLGQGIFAEFEHRQRREQKAQSLALATPRLFGRADARIRIGRDRPGRFFDQYVRYPFIGETGRYSVRQGYSQGTTYFSYSTDGTEAFGQVLVPQYREVIELSAAQRFGPRGRSWIAGLTLTRDVIRFPGPTEVVYGVDFDGPQPYPGDPPADLQAQLAESGATRVSVHLGTRRFRYVEYQGIDGLRDRVLVGHGFYAGASVGRGFGVLLPSGVDGVDDLFGRVHFSFGAPIGSSLIHGGVDGRERGETGASLAGTCSCDADLVAYLRNDGPRRSHTLLPARVGGRWMEHGRFPTSSVSADGNGVRAHCVEDRFPGGRMARFVVEDRIVLPVASVSNNFRPGAHRSSPMSAGSGPVTRRTAWTPDGKPASGLRRFASGFPGGTRNVWRTGRGLSDGWSHARRARSSG